MIIDHTSGTGCPQLTEDDAITLKYFIFSVRSESLRMALNVTCSQMDDFDYDGAVRCVSDLLRDLEPTHEDIDDREFAISRAPSLALVHELVKMAEEDGSALIHPDIMPSHELIAACMEIYRQGQLPVKK